MTNTLSTLQEIYVKQIEDIIGYALPLSANQQRAFWSNTRTHLVAVSWMNAGFKTTVVELENELITFERE
ncbi:hypothetical protein E9840_11245 [Tissierella creatinini]|nr:hypothetical protein E9840_11245 [Tissierella creatinini]TJX62910.1 hypothetical protein E8P77_16300 [Soehngenia saccharolytica]